jgi:ADP-ribose pyrophosphatase YjhB (NUDIX family)
MAGISGVDKFLFQYCQKIVIFSKDEHQILLCKRQGEADYNNTFTFIGGKMETSDDSILAGLKREKDEEVGTAFKVKILPTCSYNVLFRKQDGRSMIVPHYLAFYESGEIKLSDEYSEYRWVDLKELKAFEPKIPNIPEMTRRVLKLKNQVSDDEFSTI